jgi:hypothetical protein
MLKDVQRSVTRAIKNNMFQNSVQVFLLSPNSFDVQAAIDILLGKHAESKISFRIMTPHPIVTQPHRLDRHRDEFRLADAHLQSDFEKV